ncbi:MAG: OmpH family outer membrane protein [Pseudomonadota bacterium]
MTKHITRWAAALLLVSTASVVQAEMKIVVLDSVRAIMESDEAKLLADAANKEMETEQSELRAQAQRAQDLQARAQKDAEVLSPAEKRDIAKEIENLQIELQFGTQKLQKEVQDKRQEILAALAPKFDKVLKDIIQVDQIDLILAPNALQYANSKHDITRRVTEKLNETK